MFLAIAGKPEKRAADCFAERHAGPHDSIVKAIVRDIFMIGPLLQGHGLTFMSEAAIVAICVVRAVAVNVGVVFFGSAPSDIGKPVVRTIAVEVPCLHSLGAWSHECEQNQPMDPKRPWLSVANQVHSLVSLFIRRSLQLPPIGPKTSAAAGADPQAPNASVVANTVAGILRNVFVVDHDFRVRIRGHVVNG